MYGFETRPQGKVRERIRLEFLQATIGALRGFVGPLRLRMQDQHFPFLEEGYFATVQEPTQARNDEVDAQHLGHEMSRFLVPHNINVACAEIFRECNE